MASATFNLPPDQASPTFAHISWGTGPDKRGDRRRRRTVGRIKRGGGDGGEPARSPPDRPSFRRPRNRPCGCDICRRAGNGIFDWSVWDDDTCSGISPFTENLRQQTKPASSKAFSASPLSSSATSEFRGRVSTFRRARYIQAIEQVRPNTRTEQPFLSLSWAFTTEERQNSSLYGRGAIGSHASNLLLLISGQGFWKENLWPARFRGCRRNHWLVCLPL